MIGLLAANACYFVIGACVTRRLGLAYIVGVSGAGIATAHLAAADYEAALQESSKIARARPHLQSAIVWAAAAAALGKAEEARTAVAHCLAQRPELCVGRVAPDAMPRFARDEDHERLLTLLRQAGLPG